MNQVDLIIINGRIITPTGVLENLPIAVKDGIISSIGTHEKMISPVIIDAKGMYVSPGFIDIHVHGGGGFDFMDGTEEAFVSIAEVHARYGTTAMLPTTLGSSEEQLHHIIDIYERMLPQNMRGAQFLGLHLEGPYFAMSQRGAQDPKYIRHAHPREYKRILERSHLIKRWSAAPELPGAIDFAKYAVQKGVLMSMAHTDAIYEEALNGFNNGYTLATHLYSGMSSVMRRNAFRYAGVVEAAFLIDDMDVEIIADGVHLPTPLLQLVYKIKGAKKTALITDAMRAAGTTATESILGNQDTGMNVIIEDGVAKLPDRTAFAGSTATTDRLVRTMVHTAGVPLVEAVRMITATPASIIHEDAKGILAKGKDADIVIFDDNITVQYTIIKGKIVYENK